LHVQRGAAVLVLQQLQHQPPRLLNLRLLLLLLL
jgi:hypothetical protein